MKSDVEVTLPQAILLMGQHAYPKDQSLFVALGSPSACKKMGWSLTAVAPSAISSHSAVLHVSFMVIKVRQMFYDFIFFSRYQVCVRLPAMELHALTPIPFWI